MKSKAIDAMTQHDLPSSDFETGIYRPPSEGGSFSLLVRFTRNCPWNRCGFCAMYKQERFSIRPVAEIKQDIDAIAALCRTLNRYGFETGGSDAAAHRAILAFLEDRPELGRHHGVAMVINWMRAGAETAFIQDANSLIMKTPDFVAALHHLRRTFPTLRRVTSYGRARTVAKKPAGDLAAIREAGLDRLHLGLESGDDGVLSQIQKGVDAAGHIAAGRKAMEAGFQLSEYWMPGLGGREMWQQHADNTARVLSAINPHYIRSRPFRMIAGTPLHEMMQQGRFHPLTPAEQLMELKRMVEGLSVTSRVCFDHAGNYWKDRRGDHLFSHRYEGYPFPEARQQVLDRIAEGLRVRPRAPFPE